MRLVCIAEFRQRYFDPGSAPSTRTVKRWIDTGVVPGCQIGRIYYVDVDALRVRMTEPAAPPTESAQAVEAQIAEILAGA